MTQVQQSVARLREALLARGIPPEEIDRAEAEGRLPLLVVDRFILPGQGRYLASEVAERTGLSSQQVSRLWRALGFPDADDRERAFTDLDVEAITTVRELVGLGLTDEAVLVQMARVVGSAMARVAEAEVTTSPLWGAAGGGKEVAEVVALTADETLPRVARLLEYTWRRHLQAQLRQAALRNASEADHGRVNVTVGFADLVGFTALSQSLDDRTFDTMVAHFEEISYDIVATLGGRLVKMIGDEVMFTVGDPASAARIAVALSEAYADDELLPDVRVGLASGPVLARDGDYYGPVVNRASRLVEVARPGTVVVSEEVHDHLARDGSFSLRALRPRYLRDIGRVPLWQVRSGHPSGRARPGGRGEGPFGLGFVNNLVRDQIEQSREVGRAFLATFTAEDGSDVRRPGGRRG